MRKKSYLEYAESVGIGSPNPLSEETSHLRLSAYQRITDAPHIKVNKT